MCVFQERKSGEGETETGKLPGMIFQTGSRAFMGHTLAGYSEIPMERLFAIRKKCDKLALDCSKVRKNLQSAWKMIKF